MSKSVESVCIFIDDSNLFIEGMKYMAKQNSLVVKQDNRFRIEFAALINVLARNRPVLCKKLYGSGSLSNDALWMAMREEGIEATVFDRCFRGREKEVDSTLAADVVDKAACLRFQSPNLKPGSVTFIIVSGDRDYLQALRKVHKHGWKLEVVGWETSISERVRQFVDVNKAKGAVLITMDQLVEKNKSTYFIESRWPTQSEGDHSCFVFEYTSPQKEDDAKRLSFQVVNLIKRPCQYLRPEHDPRMIKVVMLVDYKTTHQMEKDKRNLIIGFQHGICHRVLFTDGKDIDSSKLEDTDDDDDEGGVEERCAFKFSCQRGKTCHCRHTRAEKEHFEINNRHLGAKYKSRMCRSVQSRRCAFMNTPRKCPWAHGLTDARCYFCDSGGLVGDHWMDHCPRKKNREYLLKQQINVADVIIHKLTISNSSLIDDNLYESSLYGPSDDYECNSDTMNEHSELISDFVDDDSEFGSELEMTRSGSTFKITEHLLDVGVQCHHEEHSWA